MLHPVGESEPPAFVFAPSPAAGSPTLRRPGPRPLLATLAERLPLWPLSALLPPENRQRVGPGRASSGHPVGGQGDDLEHDGGASESEGIDGALGLLAPLPTDPIPPAAGQGGGGSTGRAAKDE